MDIKFYILSGGPVVLVLLFLLLIVLILIVERYLFFKNYNLFLKNINKKILEKNITNYKELLNLLLEEVKNFPDWFIFFTKMGEIEINKKEKILFLLEENYKYLMNQEIVKMEKYLTFLASLGNLSPFIGLLGTVFGIIRSFMHLGETNLVEVNKGIAEALVATAFGLLVAIPSSLSFNYFKKKIDSLLLLFDNFYSILKIKIYNLE